MNYLERFYFHLERIVYILKLQDKKLVEYWIEQLNANLELQYTESLLMAAIFELSNTDAKSFHWTLDNLYNWKPYMKLLEDVSKFAVQKLIKKGFIPGQDFSVDSEGKILLIEDTKNVLMADAPASEHLLLEKVLLTVQNTHPVTI